MSVITSLVQYARLARRLPLLAARVGLPLAGPFSGMLGNAKKNPHLPPDTARLQKVAQSLLDTANIRINVNGDLFKSDKDTAVVYCANHTSYLDVPIMLSLAQGVIVGKNDIAADSPLAHAINFLRVTRENENDQWKPQDPDALPRAVNAGHNILVFPEATCTEGTHILPINHATLTIPFNESGVKLERSIVIQPMVFTPRTIGGKVVKTQDLRDKFALYGADSKEGPHFLGVLKLRGMEIDVDVLKPLKPADWGNAAMVQRMVRDDLARHLRQRVPFIR